MGATGDGARATQRQHRDLAVSVSFGCGGGRTGRIVVRCEPPLPNEQDGPGAPLGAAIASAVAYDALSGWAGPARSTGVRPGARWSLAGRLDAAGLHGIQRERIETRKPNMPTYHVTVEGQAFEVTVEEIRGAKPHAPPTRVERESHPGASPTGPARPGPRTFRAPMPGKVLAVHVGGGDYVAAGTILCVLEAMKMENDLLASGDGIVRSVHVSPGQTVNTGDVIMVIE